MVQLRVTWSPDGTLVERLENEVVASSGTYGSVEQAIEGIRIMLASIERDYLFPGMTDVEIETEMLARGIEEGLDRRERRAVNDAE